MKRLTILHSNDIHGHLDGFSRIVTGVRQVRQTTTHPVLYLDSGDIEETNNPLSAATKGVAMHKLLSAAGCDAAANPARAQMGGWQLLEMVRRGQNLENAVKPLLRSNIALGLMHVSGLEWRDGEWFVGISILVQNPFLL